MVIEYENFAPICTRFVTFFQIDKKRCKRHESILVRQLLFGEAYHEKLRLPGPQTGWRTVLQGGKTTTPVVARYHPDKRPWSAGGYGEKAAREFGAIWAVGHRSIYDWGSWISGLLRLSGIVPFCGRWLSPWTRLERYVTDLIDTVASSRIFLFWASLEQCQDDTQQPWIYLEKLTWVMNKTPGCLGYIWYIGDEKLTSYVGITIKHYKDPYETTSISVYFSI